MGLIRRRKGCICCKKPYDGRLPIMHQGKHINHEVEEALRDAAKADAAVDMGLFELVHQMQSGATKAERKAAKLDVNVAKQIGAFAKARAREARQCQPDAVQREEKENQMGLFDFEELELGNLLGVGGFSNVYEIKAFRLKKQPPTSATKQQAQQRKHRRSNKRLHRHGPSSSSIKEEDEVEESDACHDEESSEQVRTSQHQNRASCNLSSTSSTTTQEISSTGSSSFKRLGSCRRHHRETSRSGKGRKSSRTDSSDERYTKQQQVARKFLTKHAQRNDDVTHTKVEDVGTNDDGDEEIEECRDLFSVNSGDNDGSFVLEEEEGMFSNDDSMSKGKDFGRTGFDPEHPPHSFNHSFDEKEEEEDGTSEPIPDPASSPEDQVRPLPLPSSFRKGGCNKGGKKDDPLGVQVLSSTATTLPAYGGYDGHESSSDDEEDHDENENIVSQRGDSPAQEPTPHSGNSTTARYAVKHLREGLVQTPEKFAKAAMDLSCEAEMMMCLEHPHIVKLRGFGAGGPGAYKKGEHTAYFLIIDRLVETLEDRIWIWRRAWKNQRRRKARNIFKWLSKRVCHGCRRLSSCGTFTNWIGLCRQSCSRAANAAFVGEGGGSNSNEYPTKRNSVNDETKAATSKLIDPLLVERLKVAFDLSSALEYLHDQRIIYRDMKSSNIGFDIRGDVKLFDFGLSRFLPKNVDESEDAFRMSNVGTRRYTAPEVEWKLPYNLQADVYSFGVVLWELMTMSSPRSLPRNRKHHNLPLFQCCPCWPTELQRLIRQMLSLDPEHRPTMAEVRKALKEILVSVSDKETSDEMMLDDRYHRRRRSTFRMEVLKGSCFDQLRQDYDHLFGDFDNKSHTSASTMYSNTTSIPHEAPPTPVSTSGRAMIEVAAMAAEESLADDERGEGDEAITSHQDTPKDSLVSSPLEPQ